jgi:hypothetical protein
VVGAWVRDQASGDFRLWRFGGFDPAVRESLEDLVVPADVASRFLFSTDHPFVLPVEVVQQVPPEFSLLEEQVPILVAPMRWEPDGLGTLAIAAETPSSSFSDRDVAAAGGIADITSLALGNAHRFVELELAYVSTVEALANAVEAKDEYTSDHCRALAEMSLSVGKGMGRRASASRCLSSARCSTTSARSASRPRSSESQAPSTPPSGGR